MTDRHKTDAFSSQFAPYILAFVSEKRGMGNKYVTESDELQRFDRFVVERGYSDCVITKEIFESWTAKRIYESEKTHRSRFSIVQQLCKYMVRVGLHSYISVLPLKVNASAFKPYIFTDTELDRFIKCSYETRGCKKNQLIFPMLFELLICTGVRLGEALHLERPNISSSGKTIVLFIHGEKFDKDRLVPLANILSERLRCYLNNLESIFPNSKFVFPARHGGAYSLHEPYVVFRDILWRAGISHGGRGRGPRIHDFRHPYVKPALKNYLDLSARTWYALRTVIWGSYALLVEIMFSLWQRLIMLSLAQSQKQFQIYHLSYIYLRYIRCYNLL